MIEPAQRVLNKLKSPHQQKQAQTIKSLFEIDPGRFKNFSASCGDVLYDYSKNNIGTEALDLLLELASAAQVSQKREALFSSQHINKTEDRPVQHMALRNMSAEPIVIDGHDVMGDVRSAREKMAEFSNGVRGGSISGSGGKFTHIVNIGIGGSDLGPAMATAALAPYSGPNGEALVVHFVSNVDGAQIYEVLESIPPATTLFIIASKTFATQETMTNAETARNWLISKCGKGVVKNQLWRFPLRSTKPANSEFQRIGFLGFGTGWGAVFNLVSNRSFSYVEHRA